MNNVKEMGFAGHKKQGSSTREYFENGFIIGKGMCPLPIIDICTAVIGGVIGGAIGLASDGVELAKEKCLKKQNNDLIGFNQEDCETLNDKLILTESLDSK